MRRFTRAALGGAVAGLTLIGWTGRAFAQTGTVGLNFTGTSLSDLPALNGGYQYIPPDTIGAVGPNNFVEFTNGSYAVYSKTTGALVGSRTALTQFWTNAGVTGLSLNPTTGTGTTDTHTIFDPQSQRWYAVSIDEPNTTATNRVLIAVSKTTDPTAGWTGFAVAGTNAATTFSDFPAIGMNNDALYVSFNNFPNVAGGSNTTSILVVPKAGLTAAVPTVSGRTLIDAISPNNTGYTPHPLLDMQNGSVTMPLLSDYNTPNGYFKSSLLMGTNTASPTLNTTGGFINVTPAGSPPAMQQPGGPNTIDGGDPRFGANVIKQGGNVWAIQNIANPVGGHVAVRWFRLDATASSVLESGIIGDATNDYGYGSIAVNPNGDLVIGYTESGPSLVPSAFASVGRFDGTTTSIGSPMLLKAGTGNYNITFGGTRNRWGDYSQTTLDPSNPNVFWTVQEFVNGTNNWGTQITQITVPEPGSALIALAGVGAGLLARRRAPGERSSAARVTRTL